MAVEFHHLSMTSPVEVAAKLAIARLAFHGSYNFAIHDKGTYVSTFGFLNKLLHNNACFYSVKGLDYRLRSFFVLRQNYT